MRARDFYIKQYARKNAKAISKKSGQGISSVRRGKLSSESVTAVESRIYNPAYAPVNRRIKNFILDFDTQDPVVSMERVFRKTWRYPRNHYTSWGFYIPILDNDGNEIAVISRNTSFVSYSDRSTAKGEALVEISRKLEEIEEHYDFIIAKVDYEYMGEWLLFPDIPEVVLNIELGR